MKNRTIYVASDGTAHLTLPRTAAESQRDAAYIARVYAAPYPSPWNR